MAAPAQRTEEVDKMLGGFELNLAAMSLLSLVVGMFLIYNTVSASVARRRREIGILRSLGVTRNEVRALFLGEAIVLGSIGAFLGLAGGLLLARLLVGAVAETISSLYVLVNVKQLALDPWTFLIAWTIGLASVIVSAWLPGAGRGADGTGSRAAWRQLFPRRGACRQSDRGSKRSVRLAPGCGAGWFPFSRGRFFFSRPFDRSAMARFCRGVLCPRRVLLSRAVVDHAFQRGGGKIFPCVAASLGEKPASKRNSARRIFPALFSETRSRSPRSQRRWR